MPLWYDWPYSEYVPKSGVVGFWGRLFPIFLRNCWAVFITILGCRLGMPSSDGPEFFVRWSHQLATSLFLYIFSAVFRTGTQNCRTGPNRRSLVEQRYLNRIWIWRTKCPQLEARDSVNRRRKHQRHKRMDQRHETNNKVWKVNIVTLAGSRKSLSEHLWRIISIG